MASECSSEAIRSLVARIAHLADEGTVDDYVQLYAEDAVWEMKGAGPTVAIAPQIVEGRRAIADSARRRRADGIAGPGSATRHVSSCVSIAFDSEDSARVQSVWQFFVDTTTAPRLSGIGTYRDVFQKVDGQWLLARRSITTG
ncbi:nuclear transport factor 2 family protein [Rhodococcus maanshanensis]|uniref:SnoaL-like domain-containing protein n=1 Tax=Rhodococcus maanshanensis TaxID=183556 RepID=A0A1H7S2A0_9NOCA|nr:nuclear transport factor 2 family protein [Rhodococcus maanshanensis]SEL66478.1 SnoaL-like domain-containing protein [Rhodococcus maanshanensis]